MTLREVSVSPFSFLMPKRSPPFGVRSSIPYSLNICSTYSAASFSPAEPGFLPSRWAAESVRTCDFMAATVSLSSRSSYDTSLRNWAERSIGIIANAYIRKIFLIYYSFTRIHTSFGQKLSFFTLLRATNASGSLLTGHTPTAIRPPLPKLIKAGL